MMAFLAQCVIYYMLSLLCKKDAISGAYTNFRRIDELAPQAAAQLSAGSYANSSKYDANIGHSPPSFRKTRKNYFH